MKWRLTACGVLISGLVFGSSVAGAAPVKDGGSKLATWTVTGAPITVSAGIATREVKLSANEVAPVGFPIGDPVFVIQPGETVDLVDIFPNDAESRHTCKVRNRAQKQGFVVCGSADEMEWLGDRGALVRILLEQPYGYEGSLTGPIEDMAKLGDFIDRHPASRYVPFARLKLLSMRCRMTSGLVQGVWEDLRSLKDFGEVGESGTKINLQWTGETNQLYTSLKKQENGRLQAILDLCSLVEKLQGSVPSPVSQVGK